MPHFNRRHLIAAVGAAALLATGSISSAAQGTLPELKILAPAGAGGGWDTAARSLQQVMTAIGVARSVQVVNVPGAGGTVGLAQFATKASGKPDELMVAGITLVGAIISNQSPVTLKQVTPIARLTGDPLVIVVPASSPIKKVPDLIGAIKKDVAGTIWAGGSAGGADHILAALVTKAAGADPAKTNYVAFSGGGEALAAMLGGRVSAGVSGYGEFQGQIEAGALRALAVSSPERLAGVNVPTLKELGVNVEVVNWRGIFAGPGLTPEQQQQISGLVEKTVKSPQWAEVLKARGWSNYYAPAPEFAAFLASEQTRVQEILKSLGLAK
jgi:putative tricarboxylic transport membrane protein